MTTATDTKPITERDRLYHGIFTAALEGGIGYWSIAENYHWGWPDKPYDEDSDWRGFYSDIIEFSENEDDYDDPANPRHHIDRTVIARGLRIIADKKRPIAYLSDEVRKGLARMYWDASDADYDASDADIIVQVGLFKTEVRYG